MSTGQLPRLLAAPDADHVQRWFRQRFPERQGLEVQRLRRAFPGLSRETWFVDTRWRADGVDRRERFVLRTQLPGNVSLGLMTLAGEARLFEALETTDVPVARFYGYEDRDAWLLDGERPFFVRGWTEGVLEPAHVSDPDPAYDGVRVATVKELVEKLVRVHRLDWQALDLQAAVTPPASAAEAPAFLLDHMLSDYADNHHEPFPALVEALLSMREELPPGPDRLVLAKGNCGLGDEVWAPDGVRITALCDWETARITDPALDIAAIMRSTGWCWDLDSILGHYEELTGVRISAERVRFYSVVTRTQSIVVTHGRAVPLVTSGRDRRIQLLSIGLLPAVSTSAIAAAAGF